LTVVWRADARADVIRIVRHIAEENPIAARKIARELILAGDGLAVFPRRGRPGLIQGTRELTIVTPYVLVYEVAAGEDVSILRVWHGAQAR
jgi:plasmid stabilization system protein ParE